MNNDDQLGDGFLKGLVAGVIAIAILALLLPRGDDPDETGGAAERARPAAVFSSGSLEHENSRDGMPVFTASNVGPGTLVEGAVTIANTGKANGYFSLSQADLTDMPGPNGGALSEKLALEIVDVTRASKPVPVYRGPFAALGVRPLGFIRAGDEHRYRFTAMLSDSGGPASPVSGDNALRGSSTSARFVWSAVQGAAPGKPGAPSKPPVPRRDRRPPRLRVSFAKVQRLLTRPFVETKAACSEACTVTVTGTARSSRAFEVRQVRRTVRAGRSVRVRLRLSRPALRSVRRRLRAGRPVTVRMRFVAVDRAGNRSAVRRTLRLRPRPR